MSPMLPTPRRTPMALALGMAWLLAAVTPDSVVAAACPRCGWSPPKTRASLTVRSLTELRAALDWARPGTTILLGDGVYLLDRMLDITVPDLVLRGKGGDRSRVVIRGPGLGEHQIGVAISVSAPRVVLADLTAAAVGFHGIQVRGEKGADRVAIHNVRVIDTGQQLVKGSMGPDGRGPHEGLVACSCFEYSDQAPSDYTNGVDVLGGRGWVVRDSLFRRIRGPREQGYKAGPTVLFWGASQDTTVERNCLIDCFRGIALGLGPGKDGESFDHRGGVIRNNVVCNLNPWADEAIEANGAPGVRIEHNTVLVEGGAVLWSIGVRFPTSLGTVRNNLTNHPIVARDGARMDLAGNMIDARRDWFVDPGRANLRLARDDVPAIDAGAPIPEVRQDFDLRPRPVGKAPDAGAFEFGAPGRRPGGSGPEGRP